eukprot:m.152955 g.152955  ORF g.152955 m.152955 type:complete len:108 (+) comp38609_c0_seq10:869-1192(+)
MDKTNVENFQDLCTESHGDTIPDKCLNSPEVTLKSTSIKVTIATIVEVEDALFQSKQKAQICPRRILLSGRPIRVVKPERSPQDTILMAVEAKTFRWTSCWSTEITI